MKIKALAASTLSFLLLTGCSQFTSNMIVGKGQVYNDLSSQREAANTVKIYEKLPKGAEVITKVSAGRCHRNFLEQSPMEEDVVLDLKFAAYSKGADGIVKPKISGNLGLHVNCWYVLGGTTTAFSLKPATSE